MLREQSAIRGRRLSRWFGEGELRMQALNDVTIELGRGQIVLLMGPSGSGKSTLLAVLSGLLRPDEGQVIALGQDLWKMSERDRENFRLKHCGFIFQGYNLFPALSARQQIEMVLRWGEGTPYREARRRVDQMLELLGLTKKARLRPAQLSGGEKQRVAIGRALIKNPSLVFADEPTSALDWGHGAQVVDLLHTASHDSNAAILVVSHDARMVSHVDQVYHLEDGMLAETVEEHVSEMRNLA